MTESRHTIILKDRLQKAIDLHHRGHIDEAYENYVSLLADLPENPQILCNLGIIKFKNHDEPGEAISLLRRALEIKPDYIDALYNLGTIYQNFGEQARAFELYKKVLEINPGHAKALNNSGVALASSGYSDLAQDCYEKATLADGSSRNAAFNSSLLFKAENDHASALEKAQKSVRLQPNSAIAHFNLAACFKEMEQYLDAANAYAKSLELDPYLAYAKGYLAFCLSKLCFWSGFEELINEIETEVKQGLCVIDPFSASVLLNDPCLIQLAVKNFVEDRYPPQAPLWNGERYAHDRIRIAYLSADYHEHATAYLMAEFFEEHDANQFETYAISYGKPSDGAMRQRLVGAFDHFVDVQDKTDLEIAEMMRELEIDIAVDLKGYTAEARPGILAYRPCPIQAQYLGFPGTMGAPYIDYIIADDVIIPESHEQYYTEKVIRLPGCYQPYDSKQKISDRIPTRAEEGLPENAYVYCCFNNNYKITPEVFDVWMQILREVPDSVLWLYEGNSEAVLNLRKEAEVRGVDPSRLIFAKKKPIDEHLARHKLADLFLDTFPCNAHTTARDALQAGLPVLTMMGDTFASRVAASIGQEYESGVTVVANLDEYRLIASNFSGIDILNEVATTRSKVLLSPVATPKLFLASIINKSHDSFEQAAGKLAWPIETPHEFTFLSAGRNVQNYLPEFKQSLESLKYKNFSLMLFDDCSEDAEIEALFRGIDVNSGFLRVDSPRGKARLIYDYLQSQPLNENRSYIFLDLDDYLIDCDYLNQLNSYFKEGWHCVWANYLIDGKALGHCRSISPFIHHRRQGWRSSHPLAVSSLISKFPEHYIQDANGFDYSCACDLALSLPMLDQTIRRLFLPGYTPHYYRASNPNSHHNKSTEKVTLLSSSKQAANAQELYLKEAVKLKFGLEDEFAQENSRKLLRQHTEALGGLPLS